MCFEESEGEKEVLGGGFLSFPTGVEKEFFVSCAWRTSWGEKERRSGGKKGRLSLMVSVLER